MTRTATALCLSLLLLNTCGEAPDIEELSVTRSPIAAPTATEPTEIRIAVRSSDADELSCSVSLLKSSGGGVITYDIIDIIPGGACINRAEVLCRSSVSGTDANVREIDCGGASAPGGMAFHTTRPAGSQLQFRADAVYQKPSVIKAVGWSLTHPGDGGGGDFAGDRGRVALKREACPCPG